ncbi:hypothetical protein SBY92_004826 [Candida maltosa Xu316]
MTLEELKVKPKGKKIFICLLEGSQSTINYYSNDTVSLYVLTHGKIFKQFIQTLIKDHKDVNVVIQFTTIEDVINIFNFLYTPDSTDFTIPFPITIAYDSALYEKLQLSPDFIYAQQILRYISLKHRANIISLPKVRDSVTLETVSQFYPVDDQSAKPIFDSTAEQVNLYIPSSWDTWNKIIVQGKSALLPDSDHIIRDETKLQDLDSRYEKYLQKEYNMDQLLGKVESNGS